MNEGLELLHRQILKPVESHAPFLLFVLARAQRPGPALAVYHENSA
jgi:hypothetical protein